MAAPMNEPIVGFLPSSVLDWPGKLVAVAFFTGCPLRCPYCYNGHVVTGRTTECWSYYALLEELKKRKYTRMDGIVLSGGDPMWQMQTAYTDEFIHFVEALSEQCAVKLDTSLAVGDVTKLPDDTQYSVTLKPRSYYGALFDNVLCNLSQLASTPERLELRLTVQGSYVEVDDLLYTVQSVYKQMYAANKEFAGGLRSIAYEPVRIPTEPALFGVPCVPTRTEYQRVVNEVKALMPSATHDIHSDDMVM